MNFKYPQFLVYLPVLLLLIYFKARQHHSVLRYSMAFYLKDKVKGGKMLKNILIYLKIAALLLLMIALARPRLKYLEKDIIRPAVDIMMVMDISPSMLVLDFEPYNRIDAAKAAAKEFVSKRESDRFGIVAFAGLPVLQCPLTYDKNSVLKLMDALKAGVLEGGGTAIGLGISLGLKYLDKSEAESKIIILLTDGANNKGEIDPQMAAELAKTLGVKIYAIGAGKPGPAKLPIYNPKTGPSMITIDDELDEESLKEVASKTGGKYYRVTSLEELKQIYKEIDMLEKTVVKENLKFRYKEIFHVFLFLGGIIILIELILRFLFPGLFI